MESTKIFQEMLKNANEQLEVAFSNNDSAMVAAIAELIKSVKDITF